MAETNNNNNIELGQDVEGFEIISNAILSLVNEYPLLESGDEFLFGVLNENNGMGFFPLSGSLIQRENKDILGRTTQICNYPFYLIYRVGQLNSSRKINVKEFLDNIGRWLEKQPVREGETTYQLTDYPELTDGRIFQSIKRTTPSTLNSIGDNNTEDWVISITATYKYTF